MQWFDKIREKVRKALRMSARDDTDKKLPGWNRRAQRWHWENYLARVTHPSYRRRRWKRARRAG